MAIFVITFTFSGGIVVSRWRKGRLTADINFARAGNRTLSEIQIIGFLLGQNNSK